MLSTKYLVKSTRSCPASAALLSVRWMQVSRTVAGVTVVTYPEPGLTAGLSVVVGGGSRYENENTAGAALYLKNYTFMVRTALLRRGVENLEWLLI